MIVPEFTVPSYVNRPLNAIQSCINLYPEKTGQGYQLVGTSGLSLLATSNSNAATRGACRAIYQGEERVYSVDTNGDVYRWYYDGTKTRLATATVLNSHRVCMVAGNTQVLFCDHAGVVAYVINMAADTVAQVTDGNFPTKPCFVTYHDSRFIATDRTTGQFYLSELDDATDWTPQTYATAEGNPDDLKGVISNGSTVYMVGRSTTEFWTTMTGGDFPLARIDGAGIQVGALSASSIVTLNGSILFVGSGNAGRGAVWMIQGTTPTKISTPPIEESISTWDEAEDQMFAFGYHESGHDFYQITYKGHDTWVYDLTEGLWHKKTSASLGHHRAAVILNAFQGIAYGTASLYAFDTENGSFYKVITGYNQENGTAITRTRDFGPISDGMKRIFHRQIRIELEIVHDSSTSYTLAPTLTWTDDGGKTWATTRTLSKAITSGTTAQRVQIQADRLGHSRSRVYRVVFNPAARLILKTCNLELEEGNS